MFATTILVVWVAFSTWISAPDCTEPAPVSVNVLTLKSGAALAWVLELELAETNGKAIGAMRSISINAVIENVPRLCRNSTSIAGRLETIDADPLTLFLPLG